MPQDEYVRLHIVPRYFSGALLQWLRLTVYICEERVGLFSSRCRYCKFAMPPFYSKKRVSRFSTQEAFQHLFVENFEWDSDPENEEEEGFLHVTPTNKTKTLFYMNLSYLKKKGEKEGNDILCL